FSGTRLASLAEAGRRRDEAGGGAAGRRARFRELRPGGAWAGEYRANRPCLRGESSLAAAGDRHRGNGVFVEHGANHGGDAGGGGAAALRGGGNRRDAGGEESPGGGSDGAGAGALSPVDQDRITVTSVASGSS